MALEVPFTGHCVRASLYKPYSLDLIMASVPTLGLEQARTNLPSIAAQANAGKASVITRHGKPYAAIVPVARAFPAGTRGALLKLRGSGKRLWGRSVSKTVDALRSEWD